MSEELLRVCAPVPAGDEEAARARLLGLVPGGFEEAEREGRLELVAYVDAVTAGEIEEAFPAATATPVAPGWEEGWRAFHRPVLAGGVWLGPPWEEPPAGTPAVVIDPGRAFGTGAHATTRLCVELLVGLERGSLLDVGCGSGVLAIAAAHLGFDPVTAVDSDPVAVEVTRVNAAANAVAVRVLLADALTARLPAADVAVANIALGPVAQVLARLEAGAAITAGYLAHERPAAPGWQHVARRELEGWAADHFRHVTV